jgi:hypothetical protein
VARNGLQERRGHYWYSFLTCYYRIRRIEADIMF